MIQEKDIDMFLKAKGDNRAIGILQVLSLLSLLALVGLEVLRLPHDYTVVLATMAVAFMVSAMGQGRWVAVSRDQLIDALGRIINNDAEALKLLAEKRSANISTRKQA